MKKTKIYFTPIVMSSFGGGFLGIGVYNLIRLKVIEGVSFIGFGVFLIISSLILLFYLFTMEENGN